jgi:hypothetical protein
MNHLINLSLAISAVICAPIADPGFFSNIGDVFENIADTTGDYAMGGLNAGPLIGIPVAAVGGVVGGVVGIGEGIEDIAS